MVGNEPPDEERGDPERVEDVDDLNKRERLKGVHKEWERAKEAKREALELRAAGADPWTYRTIIHLGVDGLLDEIAALATSVPENSIWYTEPLGEIIVSPPPDARELIDRIASGRGRNGRLLSERPAPRRYQVRGLETYHRTTWPYREPFSFVYGTPRDPQEYRGTANVYPPIAISKRALDVARQFMMEQGIDFERGYPERDREAEPY